MGLIPGLGRFPWRRAWQPTSRVLPGESPEQRNLVGYSPWGCKEFNMTERLTLYKCKTRDLVRVSQGLLFFFSRAFKTYLCSLLCEELQILFITKSLSYSQNQINIGWINSNFFQSLVNEKESKLFVSWLHQVSKVY